MPVYSLKTSAVADLVHRLRFQGKADLRGELQGGLDVLATRGFKQRETAQEAVTLRKYLQQLQNGRIEAVPHEFLKAPGEAEFPTSQTRVSEVDPALRDAVAEAAIPPVEGGRRPEEEGTPVEEIPAEVLRRMARVVLAYQDQLARRAY